MSELLPAPYSARSRVHEYGGGEFLVAGGRLFFVNERRSGCVCEGPGGGRGHGRHPASYRFAGDALCRFRLGRAAEKIDRRWRDAWPGPGGAAAECALDDPSRCKPGAAPSPLIEGHDFYASPRLSPDGRRLAFLAWDLPSMPWDAAQLFVAELAGRWTPWRAGFHRGRRRQRVFPARMGSGRHALLRLGRGRLRPALRLARRFRAREGRASSMRDLSMPQWSFNAASFALLPGGRVYCTFVRNGEAGAAIAGPGAIRDASRNRLQRHTCAFGRRRGRCPGGIEGR